MAPRRPRPGASAAALLVGLATIATVLVLAGGPAAADPPAPTNYESRLLSGAPPDGVRVEIVGGDAFIAVAVDPGHEVVVPDYSGGESGRPYLRFRADGTVQVNEHSAAASANESRFGTSPDDFDPDRAPRWRTVATDGSYAWHDHRIHLMVPDDLAVVDARGRVDLGGDGGTWEVPILVDGAAVVLQGELVRLQGPAQWPWYLAALLTVLIGLGTAVGLPRVRGQVLSGGLVVMAAAATAVSVTELGRAPEGSGASVVPTVVGGVALVAAVLAVVASRAGRRFGSVTRAGTAAAAAVLVWWAITRIDVFAHTILPSDLGHLDRAVTAGALGCGLAAAVLLVWRPTRFSARPPS